MMLFTNCKLKYNIIAFKNNFSGVPYSWFKKIIINNFIAQKITLTMHSKFELLFISTILRS